MGAETHLGRSWARKSRPSSWRNQSTCICSATFCSARTGLLVMASPRTEPTAFDALFVVNRLTDESRLARICRRYDHRRVLIASSHRHYLSEKQALAATLAPTRVEFI